MRADKTTYPTTRPSQELLAVGGENIHSKSILNAVTFSLQRPEGQLANQVPFADVTLTTGSLFPKQKFLDNLNTIQRQTTQ